MRIVLAPMEGVVDDGVRDVLTRIGGYDRCVTEFIRVVNGQRIPEKVFLRFAPELEHGGFTPAGVPVYLQLLGGDRQSVATNAVLAQMLEPLGIDLNFGCPSKTVNKSDGGSVLLKEPQRVGDIVAAVRDAVDISIPVTAKIRLGYSNHDYLDEITSRIEEAGADELCIHARTRDDRYKPPAYWSAVKRVSKNRSIPIIINGEIWSFADSENARQQSGCADVMLGRGALSCPDLARAIKANHGRDGDQIYQLMLWPEVIEVLLNYLSQSQSKHEYFVSNRCKQWLAFLQRQYSEAAELFQQIKRYKDANDVFSALHVHQDRSLKSEGSPANT
ncbi:MAG: tRNA-dihydrouridine synthase [Acidiferrobacterales bacterium]|nr:tRNA-dihydrouridine synthase [Acidiferrobacterales bacterium]